MKVIICLFFVVCFNFQIYAGTVDDILYKYGKIPEVVDTTKIILELSTTEESYQQTVVEYKRNEYLNVVDDVIIACKESQKNLLNISKLQKDVQENKNKLIELVNTDTSLEDIFLAENSYRFSLSVLKENIY